jgi:hypothetical protein
MNRPKNLLTLLSSDEMYWNIPIARQSNSLLAELRSDITAHESKPVPTECAARCDRFADSVLQYWEEGRRASLLFWSRYNKFTNGRLSCRNFLKTNESLPGK